MPLLDGNAVPMHRLLMVFLDPIAKIVSKAQIKCISASNILLSFGCDGSTIERGGH